MIMVRRERFTMEHIGYSYSYLDAYHSSAAYQEVVSTEVLVEGRSWETRLLTAYDTFQRLALAVEMVVVDQRHHGDTTSHTRWLWSRVEAGVVGVLGHLHSELETRGAIIQAPLTRATIPSTIRCEGNAVVRERRDFVLLRHVLQVSSFFGEQLKMP